ncbi:hypothetical protein EG68_12001 [Paragonimus skrjabini miyazakii]|uniref:Reverse transcriptase domain-containing protein n=1 Tax=Paragonimus skrjabini miyazakii TaxID=59628 RepID=A0A8S9YCR4_9TREM|nr:hypothetical protein EG68_12001 [Paragonimus skrjabini miyazakii]
MPFGSMNAPATCQRPMQSVLRDLAPQKCLVYLDGVIAHGPSSHEHLANPRILLDRLRQVGLKLNPAKCRLMQKEVNFLRHDISKEYIQTDRTKTVQVEQWPIPLTVTEVKSFLGLASYYRRFVRNFSMITEPLNALLGKDCEFLWTEAQQQSFDQRRKALYESPILAFPDFAMESGELISDTDASVHGLGAVLSQKGETGEEHVIAYRSRSLNNRGKNYCTTRMEMLALVFFLKQYRYYLLGEKFVVRTDHQSLTWLGSFRDPKGQITRWHVYLQAYAFECFDR